MYYLRSKAATDPIKFTVEHSLQKKRVSNKATVQASATVSVKDQQEGTSTEGDSQDGLSCNMDDGCLMCGA
jgi:hypothetical protein